MNFIPAKDLCRHDLTSVDPACQVAADEAFLDWAEEQGGPEMLLFWEPFETFVVVGYANRVQKEVNESVCARENVPIFRRCSGGGTVVQMPGILNYSLILRIPAEGPLATITSTNCYIMQKNRAALAVLLDGTPSPALSVQGHTDLCLGSLKVSGNAQRRRRGFLLFHGTFLLHANLDTIGHLLPMPSIQPEYRANRNHADFIVNLNVAAGLVKESLATAWNATLPLPNPPLDRMEKLVHSKYMKSEWNLKF